MILKLPMVGHNLLHYRFVIPETRVFPVKDPWPSVDPEVDEERPGVLCQEDGRPSDLQPTVLEVQDGLVVDPARLQAVLVLEALALGLQAKLLAVQVRVLLALTPDRALHVAHSAGF